jgi:hypothetical protein
MGSVVALLVQTRLPPAEDTAVIRRTEGERIRARYAHLLLAEPEPARFSEVVEVGTIQALARLAERCGGAVGHAHDVRSGRDAFFIDEGGIRYRYRTAPKRNGARKITV